MNRIPTYKKAAIALSTSEKIGQLFMPAAFINDSEEEIQKIENEAATEIKKIND